MVVDGGIATMVELDLVALDEDSAADAVDPGALRGPSLPIVIFYALMVVRMRSTAMRQWS